MAMKNYKVTQADGAETYYQFDDSEEVGKAGLAALKRAADDAGSPVESVTQSDPAPFNKTGGTSR